MIRKTVRVLGMAAILYGVSCLVVSGITQKAFREKLNESKRLINSGDYAEACSRLQELMENEDLDTGQQAECVDAAATACCWGHDFEEALVWLARIADKDRELDPLMRARRRKLQAWAHEGLGELEQALKANREAVETVRGSRQEPEPELLADYLCHTAQTLRKLKRFDEAAAVYGEAVSLNPTPSGCMGAAELALRSGKVEEALRAWVKLCCLKDAQLRDVKELAEAFHAASRIPAKTPAPDVLLASREEWLTATACRPEVMEQLQWVLVELLLAAGRRDEALREGKGLLAGCSGELLPEVAGRMSLVLKHLDGGVARANRLLERVRWGGAGPDGAVGTDDDIAEPLSDVSLSDSVRDRAYAEALAAQPADWRGCLARAVLLRYSGNPREALQELKTAFDLAPMEQDPIQSVAKATMRMLVQLTGTPETAARYAQYQRYGAPGPDGQAGTEDDLVNPVAEFVR